MKNILKIMLMMITIYTIAGSAVYAAEIPVSDQDQLITSCDWTEISNLQDEMKKEEPDATIDYDKALKVYVDCNLKIADGRYEKTHKCSGKCKLCMGHSF